jgi:hypothetical protein
LYLDGYFQYCCDIDQNSIATLEMIPVLKDCR